MKTRYRQYWDKSELDAVLYTASVETYKKNRELVAAVDANYAARIGNGWDVNMRPNPCQSDTFLRRYKFNSSTSLKSEVVAEKLETERYYRVEASDIQGLSSGDTETDPTVLPHVFYEKIGPACVNLRP